MVNIDRRTFLWAGTAIAAGAAAAGGTPSRMTPAAHAAANLEQLQTPL
jgi:hypothetical protein